MDEGNTVKPGGLRTAVINLRVDERTKRRIEEAARDAGLTITSYLLESEALRHAHADDLFRADDPGNRLLRIILDIQRGGVGYDEAGYMIARKIRSYMEGLTDRTPEEHQRLIDELHVACFKDDDGAVLKSLRRAVPQIDAGFVPKRRHEAFVAGVRRAFKEGLIDE